MAALGKKAAARKKSWENASGKHRKSASKSCSHQALGTHCATGANVTRGSHKRAKIR